MTLLKYLKVVIAYITDMFSVRLIFQTLFLPWKRDQQSSRGLPLNEKLYVWLLNQTSRFIGFVVKSIVFLAYLVVISIFLGICLILIISWWLLPLIILSLLIFGIFQILTSTHGQ